MSKMLVAYAPCGCRCGALLYGKDDPEYHEFMAEYEQDGMTVREEEHDSIGAHFCPKHEASR